MDRYERQREVKENIEYDALCRQHFHDDVDEIVELITDTLCSTRPTLRIGGEDIPTQQVKDRFMLLNYGHLEYVFDSLAKNSTQIRNIRAYLLTALYNAPGMIDDIVHEIFRKVKSLSKSEILSASHSAKHEHQQNIKLALSGVFLDDLELIAVLGPDLVAGYAVLLLLMNDRPALLLRKAMAGFPLHRDVGLALVVVVHLFVGRHPIKAINTVFHALIVLSIHGR